MNEPQIRFSEKLVLRVPSGFSERIEERARLSFQSRSEWIRQALLSQLRDAEERAQ